MAEVIDGKYLLKRAYDGAEGHEWYCENYLKIIPFGKTSNLVPFISNPIQHELNKVIAEEMATRQYVRLAILKASQEGMSTGVASHLWKGVHLMNGSRATIIAHHADSTKRLFNMCKRFYDYLPAHLRPDKKYDNKKDLTFENVEHGWQSSMEVFTANKDNTARSGAYTACHSSEVAFHKDGEARGSIVRGIPDEPGTLVIDETTANGIDGFFYKHYWDAKNGQSDYKALFFAWFEFPKYSMEIPNQLVMDELMETILSHKLRDKYGDEEREMKLYDLKPEQMFWRRNYIRNKCQGRLIKPLDYFKQEMPANDDEAFVTTSGSVFVTTVVRLQEKISEEPIFIGDVRYTDDTKTKVKPYDDINGYLRVWKWPDTEPYENRYCAGVDTMQGGGQTGDPHSLHILDRLTNPPEIVASWRGFTETTGAMTEKLYMLALMWNRDIMYLIERAGWGVSIINELFFDKKYRKLMYDREEYKRTKKMNPEIIGFVPSAENKTMVISDLSDAINEGTFICNDKDFWKECLTFVYGKRYANKKGFAMGAITKGSGGARTFDDRVLDIAMTLYTNKIMNIGWSCRISSFNEPNWAKKAREEIDIGTTWMSS
jgi:hypothetical protein